MRIQATALLSVPEKAVLDELAETHKTTLSTVLRAALLAFSGAPDDQAVWIGAVEKGKDAT